MPRMAEFRYKTAKALRLGMPAALIVIGILTIAGCIYLPGPEHPRTPSGRDVRKVVGDLQSDKPLRVGAASRDLVLRLLGPPKLRTAHDLAIGYDCRTIAGHHFGLCVDSNGDREIGPYIFFVPGNVYAHHLLFLEFDPNGSLKRYQLTRLNYGWYQSAFEAPWKQFLQTVPDEPTTLPSERRATTEPAG
jgi:hypothetical protein